MINQTRSICKMIYIFKSFKLINAIQTNSIDFRISNTQRHSNSHFIRERNWLPVGSPSPSLWPCCQIGVNKFTFISFVPSTVAWKWAKVKIVASPINQLTYWSQWFIHLVIFFYGPTMCVMRCVMQPSHFRKIKYAQNICAGIDLYKQTITVNNIRDRALLIFFFVIARK